MKKYYAIDSAFTFRNKETWEKMYSLRLIQQSKKFVVRWTKSLYFSENDFRSIFWDKINENIADLWLVWLYLVASESMELTTEVRKGYWVKNYSIVWINRYTSKNNEPMCVISALLDTDYSVWDVRKFYMTVEQFKDFFAWVIDEDDKFGCYWLKGKNLQVIENYSYLEDLPNNFEDFNETN